MRKNTTKPKHLRVGVAIVLDDKGRVLVNHRPDEGYYGGWWEWPGGKCERGETPKACARRELREEIGIAVGEMKPFGVERAEYPGRIVKVHFFLCKKKKGSRAKRDALEHRWLAPEKISKLKFLEANLPVLRRLILHAKKPIFPA